MTGDRHDQRRRTKGLIVTGPLAPVQDEESTELVAMPTRKSRTVLLVAAGAGAALVIALAWLFFGLKPAQEHKEDALTLYQVAKELYGSGEYDAALQMLARARRVASGPRATRQIDELERQVRTAPRLERAQRLINEKSYAAAKVEIRAVLVEDPGNEKALLLSRLIAGKEGAVAVQTRRAPAPAPGPATDVVKPVEQPQPSRPKRSRRRVARRRRATLHVDSSVEGYVFIDGSKRGRSPLAVPLGPGAHTVELVSLIDPNLRVRKRVYMPAGRSARLRLELASPARTLEPKAPQGSPSADPKPAQPADTTQGGTRVAPEPGMPPTDNIDPWSR